MQIEIRRGITLQPGTFNAVVASVTAISSNADLQRFLFLYLRGTSSRTLSGIIRQSKTSDIRRAFAARQFFTTLREAGNTVVFVGHGPSLFDGSVAMPEPVAGALMDLARESLLIVSTVSGRTLSAHVRTADHSLGIVPADEDRHPARTSRTVRQNGLCPYGQRTLEVS